jgi:hypothetical protein
MNNEPQSPSDTNSGASAVLDRTKDLWEIQKYQFEDLKFADQKATALLGISDLIATVVNYFFINGRLTSDAPLLNLRLEANLRDWILVFILLAVVVGNLCAILATLYAISAIRPRINLKAHEIPLINWAGITIKETPSEWLQAFGKSRIDVQLATDIHRMAPIAGEKYGCIKKAVRWAKLEFIALLVGLTLAIILKHIGVQ